MFFRTLKNFILNTKCHRRSIDGRKDYNIRCPIRIRTESSVMWKKANVWYVIVVWIIIRFKTIFMKSKYWCFWHIGTTVILTNVYFIWNQNHWGHDEKQTHIICNIIMYKKAVFLQTTLYCRVRQWIATNFNSAFSVRDKVMKQILFYLTLYLIVVKYNI